jgi:hypothetical protein
MRTRIIIAASIVLFAVWAAFRPERAFIDRTANEVAPAGAPVSLAAGPFHGVAHEASGTATIVAGSSGERTLRLSGFETSDGPDLRVYLVAAPDASDDSTVSKAGFLDLGSLKGNRGDQNYEVPANLDLATYRTVTIWCRRFGVNFASAPLSTS